MRFDVGTTLQEWEQKLEKSEKTMKGREAVLRDAARTYQQAAKNNSWPVDFAYRDYNEAEMTLKLSDCHREFLRSQAEVRRKPKSFTSGKRHPFRVRETAGLKQRTSPWPWSGMPDGTPAYGR